MLKLIIVLKKSEIRRKDFLNVTLNRKEDLKTNIAIGKGQLNAILKETNNINEKIISDEISYTHTITDMQIKLDQLKEKQNIINSKFHVVMKNYEKKKHFQKVIQEKYNEKQKINDTM